MGADVPRLLLMVSWDERLGSWCGLVFDLDWHISALQPVSSTPSASDGHGGSRGLFEDLGATSQVVVRPYPAASQFPSGEGDCSGRVSNVTSKPLAGGRSILCVQSDVAGVSCHRRQSANGNSAAKWQVERGSAMAKGTIKKLISDKGFGFILTEEGKDLFFHRSQLQGLDFSSLREGQEVEYEAGTGRGGRPEAAKVKLASPKTE
jgi:CspA family cold shock protein